MAVPVSQMWAVSSYVLKNRLQGRKHYPLVVMLATFHETTHP